MMKISEDKRRWGILVFLILSFSISFVQAEETDEYQEGFLTSYLNRAIEKSMEASPALNGSEGTERLTYGRHITKYVSAPQFGGYVVGKYSYSNSDNVAVNNGFECRLVRVYVSGTVLRDFKYRIQMELKGTPSMRDYTLEWVRFKEFQIKVGQFKRCFSYENMMNPWEVGLGNFSQLAGRMTALASEDCCGEPAQNGRDQGLQFMGDLFPIGKDKHRLIRYQAAVYNGNGQNQKDNNNKKDWIGNIQVQPVKDLYIGLFGWTGTYTGANKVSVRRNRWALSGKYEYKDWTFRAEYAHHTGYHVDMSKRSSDKADAWYVLAGVPVTRWLKIYGSYDVYRQDATWNTMRSVYSICPNFQLHKNLMFQVQYNYVNDRTATDRNYHELWAQTWVRF